ncbi:aspartate aminotransferase family protein [Leeia oryzae]|uniref:aspartate aminotransferase family protein n=1 Tax=Leeia oryzae TaxID=356662 RepID=UPI0003746E28|nr:aminotransferase class III-fold pyridoxal phosphate-dependent enzyme [Leeia oryzae]
MTTTAQLNQLRADSVSQGIKTLHPVYMDRAENALVWDTDGKQYLDFVAGIGVLNTGHRHPRVMAAAMAQMERFTHSCFNAMPHAPYVQLTSRLAQLCHMLDDPRTMLTSSGAEAMENAIKLARAFTRRTAMIAFDGGFHGRTLATLALTAKVKPYKHHLGPLPGPVYHAAFASPDNGVSREAAMASLERLFKVEIDPADVAAIVIEPIQGEGGFLQADTGFLQDLRQVCDQHGILLIVDEIQSGFGRSGKWFAIEHSGVRPDLLVMGKSLAGGFPLAAVSGRGAVMNCLPPGGLGGTYAGNVVACAAALAVCDAMVEEDLLTRANEIGERIDTHLRAIAAGPAGRHLGAIRGVGAMRAFEIVTDGKPDAAKLQRLLVLARDNGLLLIAAGEHGNVIRLLPPLTMPLTQLDDGFQRLASSLADLV